MAASSDDEAGEEALRERELEDVAARQVSEARQEALWEREEEDLAAAHQAAVDQALADEEVEPGTSQQPSQGDVAVQEALRGVVRAFGLAQGAVQHAREHVQEDLAVQEVVQGVARAFGLMPDAAQQAWRRLRCKQAVPQQQLQRQQQQQ